MAYELIDYEGALDRLGDDPEFLAELLNEMLNQLEISLPDLETAISNEEYDSIHHIAHGLKGASANLNLTRFFHLFKELEEQGNTHRLNGAKELFHQINETTEALREYIQKL